MCSRPEYRLPGSISRPSPPQTFLFAGKSVNIGISVSHVLIAHEGHLRLMRCPKMDEARKGIVSLFPTVEQTDSVTSFSSRDPHTLTRGPRLWHEGSMTVVMRRNKTAVAAVFMVRELDGKMAMRDESNDRAVSLTRYEARMGC